MIKSEPTNRLLAPNIYLFAYHLKEETNSFWQDCDAVLNQFPTENRVLFQDKLEAMEFALTDSPKIEVFAKPLSIKDGCGLFFNIGYDDEIESLEEVNFETIKKLNSQGILLLPKKEKFLGQTLLITGYLPTFNKQHDAKYLHELANNCSGALFEDNNPPLYRSGELFGSSIFEYGNKANNYQILIWLFRDEKAHKLAQNCLDNLIDLLFYRAKIVKAFADSRLIYKGLDRAYSQIEKSLDEVQEKVDKHCDTSTSNSYLEDFKNQLKDLGKESLPYTRLLGKMEDFDKTIEINLFNYNETINLISGRLGIEKEEREHVSFVNNFFCN